MSKKVVFLCFLVLVLLFGCKKPGGTDNPNQRPGDMMMQPVSVQAPMIMDLKNFLTYSVPLKALRDVYVVAPDNQRIKRIFKKEGDWVNANESLARMDDEEMLLIFQKTKSTYEKAKNNFDRTKELFENNMVSSENFDNTRLDFQSVEAEFKLQEKRLRDLRVISPISGVVGRKFIEAEDLVSNGQKLFRVVDTTTLKAEINLPEKEFSFVKIGNRVEFAPSEGKVIIGSIHSISPIIDEATGTFNVEVHVRGSKTMIPGMFVKMNIVTREKKNCVTIPARAIVTYEGKKGVFIVADDTAVFKEVTTGILDGNFIEIEKGLLPEEKIIVTGQNLLKDGQKVRVIGGERRPPNGEKKDTVQGSTEKTMGDSQKPQTDSKTAPDQKTDTTDKKPTTEQLQDTTKKSDTESLQKTANPDGMTKKGDRRKKDGSK